MSRPEYGMKCVCVSCAQRFYDLSRSPAVCPKCGTTQPIAALRAPRPARMHFGSARMNRYAMAPIAEEEVEPLAAVEADEDDDRDADAEVPEIEADEVDPVIIHD